MRMPDNDLQSIQEARDLVEQAKEAHAAYGKARSEQTDQTIQARWATRSAPL